MERNFDNREFERYIKSNADQYRMIPSEKVWKGISGSLHTRRTWYGFGFALLLLLTGISVTWVMVSYSPSKKQEIGSAHEQTVQPVKQGQSATGAIPGKIGNISFNTFNPADVPATGNQLSETETLNSLVETYPALSQQAELSFPENINIAGKNEVTPAVTNSINGLPEPSGTSTPANKVFIDIPAGLAGIKPYQKNTGFYPLTIESPIAPLPPAKKISRKLTWQVFFAPTVSYRKLSVNKSYEGIASPFSTTNYPFASSGDVNNEVVHKPDMGLELGLSAKYPVAKNVNLIGGVQFNINRYDIKAFAYSGEQATINLNGGNGNNSVTAWTNYRNYNGYRSDWLKNFYFSVSIPVGAELRVLGNDRVNLGIAGTVQPTYILKDRAFLISTDYKNYVKIPRLIRHININTSLETFVSIKARNASTRWQIGPQVRYQVLSSFKNKYPVKENLFDFGLKIGVSLNQ